MHFIHRPHIIKMDIPYHSFITLCFEVYRVDYLMTCNCILLALTLLSFHEQNHLDEYEVCFLSFPLKVYLLHYFSGHRKHILENLKIEKRIGLLQQEKHKLVQHSPFEMSTQRCLKFWRGIRIIHPGHHFLTYALQTFCRCTMGVSIVHSIF